MKSLKLQTKFVDACFYGDHIKVLVLLKRGAEINCKDERGYNPLHMACQEGHLRIVKILVENGADLEAVEQEGESALFRAIGEGHLRIVQFLIKNGSNVNARRGPIGGGTPLHSACAWNRLKIAVALVRAEANLEALDKRRRTPIYFAVMYGHTRIVSFLIKRGAQITRKDRSGNTLLDIAAKKKDRKMFHILKSAFAGNL